MKEPSKSMWDVIVVGSGAGGSSAAYGLAKEGVRVCMIDRGDFVPTTASPNDFLSRDVWQGNKARLFSPNEAYCIGGKTKWGGAALLRIPREQFLSPGQGYLGWPISYTSLEPYYEKAEELLKPQQFKCEPNLLELMSGLDQSWGCQPIPLGITGDGQGHLFDGVISDLKQDAETVFLKPILATRNFVLVPNTRVVKVVLDKYESVVGVKTRGGVQYEAPIVIMAAGALNSPGIIKQSLAEEVPFLGSYLKMQHITTVFAIKSVVSDLIRKTMLITNDEFPNSIIQPLGLDTSQLRSYVPGIIANRTYGFSVQTEDESYSGNCARWPSLRYTGMESLRKHRDLVSKFRRALFAQGYWSMVRQQKLERTDYACGTLLAGPDPKMSCVSPYGRVHSVHGLYVSDSSVLPRSFPFPALTLYAWGLRLAEMIATST